MKSNFKSLLLPVLCVFLNLESQNWVFGAPQVACYFIFGNSLSDNGNNNHLSTTAKANYGPYGINFPKGPTGRFSNGRNLADFLAEFLGFDNYIPPFKSTTGSNILQGVNYASGGAGIRYETGRLTLGEVISLDEQLKNHNYTISQIRALLRNNTATSAHLKSCLYTVEIGNNDYLNNYFRSQEYATSIQFTPQEYAIALTTQLSSQMKTLYGQGARKIAIFGAGVLGCTPYAITKLNTQGSSPCVDKINNAVRLYNIALKSLVEDLNNNLTDAKFIFVDAYKISTIDTPNQGELIWDAPCCKLQPNKQLCVRVPFGKVCPNRTNHIFWDGVHPNEDGIMSLASRAFIARDPNDTYPFDISHLAQLPLE